MECIEDFVGRRLNHDTIDESRRVLGMLLHTALENSACHSSHREVLDSRQRIGIDITIHNSTNPFYH